MRVLRESEERVLNKKQYIIFRIELQYHLRAFLSSLVYAKKCFFFLAFLTQKLAPSRVLNAIIFCIDEQCNLIFETALFTNCKIYINFLLRGAHFLFNILFLSHFHFIFVALRQSFLCSLSPDARRLYLPL